MKFMMNALLYDPTVFGENYSYKFAERYKQIGLNIALQRKMKGLNQIQLAEKVGISRTHMSNIEAPNMLTPVSLEVIFEIADALNIKPEVLFVMSDE